MIDASEKEGYAGVARMSSPLDSAPSAMTDDSEWVLGPSPNCRDISHRNNFGEDHTPLSPRPPELSGPAAALLVASAPLPRTELV